MASVPLSGPGSQVVQNNMREARQRHFLWGLDLHKNVQELQNLNGEDGLRSHRTEMTRQINVT